MDPDRFTATIDHEEIKSWANNHHGRPEVFVTPGVGNPEPGIRINFPGKEDDVFLGDNTDNHEASWDEFFKQFENMELAFLYDPNADDRQDLSMSYLFIKRDAI